MKKAKAQFDGLVEKIRSREDISFGQMEKVFAEAFLKKFLERISSESERKKSDELYSKHIADETGEYYDEAEPMPDEKKMHYELDVLRKAVGVLGVRPSASDVNQYIKFAIKNREWDMLESIFGLVKDASKKEFIGDEEIAKIALENIVYGEGENYSKIKELFGEIQITDAVLRPMYNILVTAKDFEGLQKVKETIGKNIPKDICQKAYESFFDRKDMRSFFALHSLFRIKPDLTEKIENYLKQLSYDEYDFSRQDHGLLEEVFGIFSNKAISLPLQEAALHHPKNFSVLYSESKHKLGKKRILEEYKKLHDESRHSAQHGLIIDLVDITRVIPQKNVVNAVYERMSSMHEYKTLLHLMKATGIKPKQNLVLKIYNEIAEKGSQSACILGYSYDMIEMIKQTSLIPSKRIVNKIYNGLAKQGEAIGISDYSRSMLIPNLIKATWVVPSEKTLHRMYDNLLLYGHFDIISDLIELTDVKPIYSYAKIKRALKKEREDIYEDFSEFREYFSRVDSFIKSHNLEYKPYAEKNKNA